MIEVAVIALVFLLFSLFSRRLQNTILTAPIVFVAAGMLLGSEPVKPITIEQITPYFLLIGSTALGLSFFNDASRINPYTLPGNARLPGLLLIIALPLTILLGTLVAVWLFPGFTVIEAALLATIQSPSDAGLIATVVSSRRVPARIRQAINVESSLNDGITTPFAALFTSFAMIKLGSEEVGYQILSPFIQIGLAVLVGLIVAGAVSWALRVSDRRRWISPSFQGMIFPCLTMITLTITYLVGGNYFIACFVAGLTTAFVLGNFSDRFSRFSETLEQLFTLIVFLILGVIFVQRIDRMDWRVILYAVAGITLLRMLPVAIALRREKLQRESLLFLGWFGPRGLASVVLGTIVLSTIPGIPQLETISLTVMAVVVLSVFVHGASSIPLVVWYGRKTHSLSPDSAENRPVSEIPIRLGWSLLLGGTDERITGWEAEHHSREVKDDSEMQQ